ncbi:MAG: serine/threonine-protein kinase [Anaerolineae bacterium]|nr:PQQ-binding-like beta-propeller repeat protein [Anaerolineae bacterium]MDW8067873.1 serine/threonine-protein kinase [Anaerolineae bacterium]
MTESQKRNPSEPEEETHKPPDDLSTRVIPGLAARVGSRVLAEPAVPAPAAAPPTRPIGPVSPSPKRTEGWLPEGTVLQNRYRILGVLGAGGMSVVYKAQDLRFPKVTRLCAIKEMLNTTTDPRLRALMVQNFEREASILATLSHPAIPQVYDYFTEGDRAYLVTEFISGKDLEALLNETEGFFSEAQVVQWAIQICDVLTYLHTRQPQPVVFRDMKPSNIMLDDQGRIHLVDFGIAKVFQSGEKGTMIGTEGYSPPEQYRGIAEPRGDIYALGATLHHLLTKQDPRLEPPFSFQKRPIHQYNPAVSAELQEIIYRALEYDVQKRFGSAEEMKRALLSLKSARGLAATAYISAPETVRPDALKVIWQFACEDEVRSSPCIHEGILYIGAYDNNLYALDAETGKFLWKYAAEGGIASSPVVAEGRVFFGSIDHSLYAVNAETGRLLWTCPTKGRIFASPRVQFGHVFIGSDDHRFYAVNVANGRVAWSVETEGAIRSTPAIGPDAIYFGDEAGILNAVGVNGRLLWRFRARRALTSSPAIAHDLLYVGSQDWFVYALDLRAGWVVWRYRTDGPVVSSPTVVGNTLYIGSADGHVYALDATNGYLVWRYRTGGQVTSSPTVHQGAVYVGSVDGCLYSLDAQTGQLRWRFQTGGPVVSSPRAVNDIVYFGSLDHNVYALPI